MNSRFFKRLFSPELQGSRFKVQRSRFWLQLCLLAFCLASILRAQPVINTLAGYSGQGYADGPAAQARFFQPLGAAIDGSGNIFVADTSNHTIRKVTPDGAVTTIAGLAGISGSVDGAGANARFNQPQGIAVGPSGNIYVGDTGNNTIRMITPAGVVTTFAGRPGVAGSGNGSGTNAFFSQPAGVAVDNGGNLYVADYGNSTIRKITSGGSVSTFAGTPGSIGTNNGSGTAQFYLPQGIAVDGSGTVYVADTANHSIRKITSGGSVSTIAGSPGTFGSSDVGSGQFYQPTGIAVDGSGTIFVADTLNQTIRKITSGGGVSTVAGLAGGFGFGDGANNNVRFWNPSAVTVGAGYVLVVDSGNGTLRKLTQSGPNWTSTTLIGPPSVGNADGQGTAGRFFWPAAITRDAANNIYIADAQNHTIRKISPSGAVSTIAGLAGVPGSMDADGSSARFFVPQGVAADPAGNVYVADTGNNTIREVAADGSVSTLAGSSGVAGIADGSGTALFNQPHGIAIDSSGTVYVSDALSHTIRKITSGVVSTLAGSPLNPGSVDGTNSVARFNSPAGLATDSSGNLYVCDSLNHTIRRVTSTGQVTTVAGLSGVFGSVDGTNSAARFCRPLGLTVDSSGNIYVADTGNQIIRQVSPVGTNWIVTTVAGIRSSSGSADRLAPAAQLNNPAAIAIDSSGFVYVADSGNNAVRINKLLPPTMQLSVVQTKAVVSWPLSAPGVSLESASSLNPGTTWSVIPAPVFTFGQNYVVTNDVAGAAAFYRLHKP